MMREISFFHDRRMIKHIIFWVSILAFFTVLRAFERGLKIVLINNFLYLLIDIPIVYIILYYLWPRFFVKDRILSFIASVLILYTGAIFYSRLINYYINPLLGYHVEKGSLIEDAMYSMIVLGFISVLALVFKLLDEKYLFSIREEEYKKLRAEAELKLLRFQINPHFLFNSLSSVQGLMYHDARMADKMLTELSEFLRYTLAYTELVFVPLDKEIEIIKKYLNIEKIFTLLLILPEVLWIRRYSVLFFNLLLRMR